MRFTSALPLSFVVLLAACGSSSSSSDGSSGNGPATTTQTTVPAAECTTRCEAKLDACKFPSEATQGCATLCKDSLSTEQLACFEAKSCSEVASMQSLDALCPEASTPAAPGGKAGGETGASQTCTASSSSTPFCDGDSVAVCKTTPNGVPYKQKTTCNSGKCEGAECWCSEKRQCAKVASCSCADGTSRNFEAAVDCVDNRCRDLSQPDCNTVCRANGGAKE